MRYLLYLLFTCVLASCNDPGVTDTGAAAELPDYSETPTEAATDSVAIHPVFHGSTALTQGELTILIDPYDGAERYTGFGAPDLVLITHTHPDHMDTATLNGLDLTEATLIAPQAVVDALGDNAFAEIVNLGNGENYDYGAISVTAVAAYNPPPKENFHPKGRFNGYVIELDGARYYFSGDTEGVPEMRALDNIDYAFVCMNLPYTMDVEQAASAVAEFAPRVVYPYHYRNQDESKSDVAGFRRMVQEREPDIEVRLEDWYPAK